MKTYELTYLISPGLSEEELKSLEEKIVSQVKDIGGILNEISGIIKKSLAYPIKKNTSAFLATLSFQLPSENLDLLHKKLKAESNILRYLISGKPKIKETKFIPRKIIPKKVPEKKVELKEIEKKLEEILGET